MPDVFGRALSDFMKGEKNSYVVTRDDGYHDEEQIERYFWQYIQWPDYEREVLKEARGKILDIGAGAGRHSLWLQNRGFDVNAIDISPLVVEVLKNRGVKKVELMPVQRLAFPENSFDTVLMMFNNFGLAGSVNGTQRVLERIHKITTDKGQIIATIRDPTVTEIKEHLKYHEQNRKRGRPIGQVTIRLEYKGEKSDWFDLLILTPKELENLVKVVGWKIEKLVVGTDGWYGVVLKKSV